MKKNIFFLILLACSSFATVQAQENSASETPMAAIRVDIGPRVSGGYYGGYYDNCTVWAGPGWYYGYWFNSEPNYYTWCSGRYSRYGYYPYYRGYGYGWSGRHYWGGRGHRWGGRHGHRGGHRHH